MTPAGPDPEAPTAGGPEQLSLVEAPAARRRAPAARGRGTSGPAGLAAVDPVARVVIDTPLAHLDRPFDYGVPETLSDRARPGVRVRVRFAGQEHDGFVVERVAQGEHPGRLEPLRRVVGDEPVLTPQLLATGRAVASYYGGTLADVLRLAIPPRHARAEGAVAPPPGPGEVRAGRLAAAARVGADPAGGAWTAYPAGPALLARLAAGEGPAAAWAALPACPGGTDWPDAIAEAAVATLVSGRGTVVVLPDHRDVDRVTAALDRLVGPGGHTRLTADLGPGERYRAWVSVLRGHTSIVVGTRAAAYAPVEDPGLFVVWDDGDDSLREQRTPYPHVREVLRLRARCSRAGLLLGGFTRTAEVQHWVEQGLVRQVLPERAGLRAAAPRVQLAGEGHEGGRDAAAGVARIPSLAWRTVRAALGSGPVLVQVPRRGYAVGLSCARCRHPVRCTHCHGPVEVTGADEPARCRWCGRPVAGGPCTECGATGRRGTVLGEARTAEEIGRAFPGVPVRTSRAGHLLAAVGPEPAIVVATPGAEPVAEGGYRATLLLDGWALLDRPGLDTEIETLRRWAAAAALTVPGPAGGTVVLVGVPPHARVRPAEALVRWDPVWLVERELAERTALGLPPVLRTATVTGDAELLCPGDLLEGGAEDGDGAALVVSGVDVAGRDLDVLGPVTMPQRTTPGGGSAPQRRFVLRDTPGRPGAVVGFVRDARAARSAHKGAGHLISVLDPPDIAS